MKDTVFIGWTVNNDLAIKVKDKIDQGDYLGVVGGNYTNNPEGFNLGGTIRETVVRQMNHSDQAILIFNKPPLKEDGSKPQNVSANLVYEYGYLDGLFGHGAGIGKIIIFTIDFCNKEDELLFPSDLRGSWVHNIPLKGIDQDVQQDYIVQEIVRMFNENQVQVKKNNLFMMMNDYPLIEQEMDNHKDAPLYSDYDFATYLLAYAMSGFCFQEHFDHQKRLNRYSLPEDTSIYIKEAVTYVKHTLDLYCKTSPSYDEKDNKYKFNFDSDVLGTFTDAYKDDSKSILKRLGFPRSTLLKHALIDKEMIKTSPFESLLIAQLQEHMTYALLLYLHSAKDEEERKDYAKRGIDYGLSCVHNLNLLKEERNYKEYSLLLESYEYKNLSTFYKEIGDENNYIEYKYESLDIRDELRLLDPNASKYKATLVEYLTLEYYSQLIDMVDDYDDEKQKKDSLKRINDFILKCENQNQNRLFMFNMLKDEYRKHSK